MESTRGGNRPPDAPALPQQRTDHFRSGRPPQGLEMELGTEGRFVVSPFAAVEDGVRAL
ncbi:MAG: hypothetical protein HMLKMBBP_01169 [Planctomycetes bacterium]|nr:hypothetical protein [Planctomycetota bacterium]